MAQPVDVLQGIPLDSDPSASKVLRGLRTGHSIAGLSYLSAPAFFDLPVEISWELTRADPWAIAFETTSIKTGVPPKLAARSQMPFVLTTEREEPIEDKIAWVDSSSLAGLLPPADDSATEGIIWKAVSDLHDAGEEAILPGDIEERLITLARLPADWDSYGASPVSRIALEKTRRLLSRLYAEHPRQLPFPFIAPDPEGGLGLEWDFGPMGEIFLEVSSRGQSTYLFTMGRGSEQEPVLADDLNALESLFRIMRR